jgi:hypothetical protein
VRPAFADTVLLDPLHGACGGGTATCGADNGTLTPLTSGTGGLSGFGWTGSPAQSGDLLISILVPTGSAFGDGAITGTGIGAGGVIPMSAGTFSSGDLASFLGITASPNNPLGGFQVGLDSGVSSFQVFTADVGQQSLLLPSAALNDIFAEAGQLTAGTDFVAFLLNSSAGGNTATALSGQLQLENTVGTPTPIMGSGWMLLSGLGGMWWLNRRRKKAQPTSMLTAA